MLAMCAEQLWRRLQARQPLALPVVVLAPFGGANSVPPPPPEATVRCWVFLKEEEGGEAAEQRKRGQTQLWVSEADLWRFAEYALSRGEQPGLVWARMLQQLAQQQPNMEVAMLRYLAPSWAH